MHRTAAPSLLTGIQIGPMTVGSGSALTPLSLERITATLWTSRWVSVFNTQALDEGSLAPREVATPEPSATADGSAPGIRRTEMPVADSAETGRHLSGARSKRRGTVAPPNPDWRANVRHSARLMGHAIASGDAGTERRVSCVPPRGVPLHRRKRPAFDALCGTAISAAQPSGLVSARLRSEPSGRSDLPR